MDRTHLVDFLDAGALVVRRSSGTPGAREATAWHSSGHSSHAAHASGHATFSSATVLISVSKAVVRNKGGLDWDLPS